MNRQEFDQALVNGFVRSESPESVPTDIIKVILLFYNAVYRWKFTKNELHEISRGISSQTDHHASWAQPAVRNLSFGLTFATIWCIFCIQGVPADIKSLRILYVLSASHSKERKVGILKLNAPNSRLMISDIGSLQSLCVNVYIDIISICYAPSARKSDYFKQLCIPKKTQYECTMSMEDIQGLLHSRAHTHELVLPNALHDAKWAFVLRCSRGRSLINGSLWVLPFEVRKCKCDVSVSNNFDGNRVTVSNQTTTSVSIGCGLDLKLTTFNLVSVELCNEENECIPAEQWAQYRVV